MYGNIYDPIIKTLPSLGAARSRRCPEGKISLHSGSMSPSLISNQPMGGGVSARCGAVSTQGNSVFDPGFRRCRRMKCCLIKGLGVIFPGCRGVSMLSRGATLVVHWLHEPQPNQQSDEGGGVPTYSEAG